MAGPITIKLKEDVSYEDLIRRVQTGWDNAAFGEPRMQDINGKRYLAFPGTDWISAIAYPERKKVVVQAMPGNYNVVYSKEGREQLKKVNREVLPLIADGLRALLADIVK